MTRRPWASTCWILLSFVDRSKSKTGVTGERMNAPAWKYSSWAILKTGAAYLPMTGNAGQGTKSRVSYIAEGVTQ